MALRYLADFGVGRCYSVIISYRLDMHNQVQIEAKNDKADAHPDLILLHRREVRELVGTALSCARGPHGVDVVPNYHNSNSEERSGCTVS